MLHPEVQYHLLKSMQEECMHQNLLAQEIKKAQPHRQSWRDRLLLTTGNMFISFGVRLKTKVHSCYRHSPVLEHQ